jgi:hypothetical protein
MGAPRVEAALRSKVARTHVESFDNMAGSENVYRSLEDSENDTDLREKLWETCPVEYEM